MIMHGNSILLIYFLFLVIIWLQTNNNNKRKNKLSVFHLSAAYLDTLSVCKFSHCFYVHSLLLFFVCLFCFVVFVCLFVFITITATFPCVLSKGNRNYSVKESTPESCYFGKVTKCPIIFYQYGKPLPGLLHT